MVSKVQREKMSPEELDALRAYEREYYRKNKEKRKKQDKAKSKRYREKHRERIRERNRLYDRKKYWADPEAARAKKREQYEKHDLGVQNAERQRAYHKKYGPKYYAANREKIIKQNLECTSKRKYGEYWKAHRALCKLEKELRDE